MPNVRFFISADRSTSTGTPVTAQFISAFLAGKRIIGAGYDGTDSEVVNFNLTVDDGTMISFHGDQSGPIVTFCPPSPRR